MGQHKTQERACFGVARVERDANPGFADRLFGRAERKKTTAGSFRAIAECGIKADQRLIEMSRWP